MVKHISTFANAAALAEAYNKGEFRPPYVATMLDHQIGTTPAGEPVYYDLYSNRLPWQPGDAVPPRISANCDCGEWILNVSTL